MHESSWLLLVLIDECIPVVQAEVRPVQPGEALLRGYQCLVSYLFHEQCISTKLHVDNYLEFAAPWS